MPCEDVTSLSGEEVVISGISGKFPMSDTVKELQEHLLNGTDCITDDTNRWDIDNPKIPRRIGKINGICKFDRLFFGVHVKQVESMDPMNRMMLECCYEAVIDSGINPRELRGSRIAVFMGSAFSESEKAFFYEKVEQHGFGLTGCSRAMLPNRTSFFLGLIGTSINIDSACSSSGSALEQAFNVIKSGEYDGAIVGGAALSLHPHMSLHLSELGLISSDGYNKSFDSSASGYTRSETVTAIFLQRANLAKRIYAEVVNVKSLHVHGSVKNSVIFPTYEHQVDVMKQTLKECGVSPSNVLYVEADGLGIKDADADEANAIDAVYNEGRTSPLLIGSVKSNIGHTSAANTINSMTKVMIAMEAGSIPPNLHYNSPSEKIDALVEGRLRVVTEPTPWPGGYAAVNTTSFGGTFVHVLLKARARDKKNGGLPDDDLPRLVVASGCTEEAVDTILTDLESRPADVEMVQLLHDIYQKNIPAHLYRGYTVLPPRGVSKEKQRNIQNLTGVPQQIWYIFSGMGSQWIGMGESLMRIPIFAESIRKCDAILKPRGYDIVRILTDKDPTMFDNIVNSFVGIAAIQIGLVDILTALGIKPDFIIGHSVGELGCAYADGCFTAKEMILCALSRGLASTETKLLHGSMAAVGLGYDDILPLCPKDIDIACHNGPDSTTISGPAESMKTFVAELQAKGIFAREVACSNIAYHSRYIAPAGPNLLKYLQKVIPEPRPRSSKWISSSVPRSEWITARARLSSAEYHTNNLLSPVLFAESAKLIPKNAITIEIAPHGLLQAILRRSLPESCVNIPLTMRDHEDNVKVLSAALGKLYNAGVQLDLTKLYTRIQYPVSRGTPSISSLVRWNHSVDWYTNFFSESREVTTGEQVFKIDLNEDKFKFLNGHCIADEVVVPWSVYLTLVWEILKTLNEDPDQSVVFKDVFFHQGVVTVPRNDVLELTAMVQKGSGRFEVIHKGSVLATGNICTTNTPFQESLSVCETTENEKEELSEHDFYKELHMRGYHCSGSFRNIRGSSMRGSKGRLAWLDNWTTYLNGMMQMYYLGCDTRQVQVPVSIQKMVINTKYQQLLINKMKEFPVIIDRQLNIISSCGAEICGLQVASVISDMSKTRAIIEEYRFVANRDEAEMTLSEAVLLVEQLLVENLSGSEVNVIELLEEEASECESISSILRGAFENSPSLKVNIGLVAQDGISTKLPNRTNVWSIDTLPEMDGDTLLIVRNLWNDDKTKLLSKLNGRAFLLSFVRLEDREVALALARTIGLSIVLERKISFEEILILFRKKIPIGKTRVIEVAGERDSWISKVKSALRVQELERVLLVVGKDLDDIIEAIVKVLRKESGGEKLRIFDIRDSTASKFSLREPLYQDQFNLDLVNNVLKPGNVWGTLRHLPPSSTSCQVVSRWVANQLLPGDLNSVTWIAGASIDDDQLDELVRVEYSTINLHDLTLISSEITSVEATTGKRRLDESTILGHEYSGRNSKGLRVMGMTSCSAVSNLIVSDPEYTWRVPETWSMMDAATVPLAYAIAYHALYTRGRLQRGDKVLVHNGSSDVGQAAINLALNEDCEVFTTFETEEEQRFIRHRYPRILGSHVSSFVDDSFKDAIFNKTKNQGVNVILFDYLDFSKLDLTLACSADSARVVMIGNFEDARHESIGMEIFLKNVSLYTVIPENLLRAPSEKKRLLAAMIAGGIDSGLVRPLSRKVYSYEMLKNAVRDCFVGQNCGKVLVKVHPDEQPTTDRMLVVPARFHCLKTGSYLIVEGLSDFALELVDWLVVRGARKIILTSRAKIDSNYQNLRITLWRSYGVAVIVRDDLDISNERKLTTILNETAALGPVDAVFDLQRVCRQNSPTNCQETLKSRAVTTKLLDEVSRVICPRLRRFVVCSSSLLKENARDLSSRDKMAERTCERRVQDGLPGLLILWDPIERIDRSEEMIHDEFASQLISVYLKQLDELLQCTNPVVSVRVVSSEDSNEVPDNNETNDVPEEFLDEATAFKANLYKQEYVITSRFGNLREA